MRTCVITGEKLPKQELIRIVKNKDNEIFVDITGKQNGRGIYIKKDLEVLEKAKKTKIMDKLLENKIDILTGCVKEIKPQIKVLNEETARAMLLEKGKMFRERMDFSLKELLRMKKDASK